MDFRKTIDAQPTVVRLTAEVRCRLESLLFSRYPNREWACFFLFGTRRTRKGLLLTIVELLEPGEGDLDPESDIVSFSEPYTLRAALRKQDSGLSIGTIHSHPEGCWPKPSRLDDDMDGYYAEYFPLFGSSGTYFGLIFSRDEDGRVTFSGRGQSGSVYFRVTTLLTIGDRELRRDSAFSVVEHVDMADSFHARLGELYGIKAAQRLKTSRVAIIGVSGTGSPAAHVLARAGVKNFVLIDPQRLAPSNLERVHGSSMSDFDADPPPHKVAVVRDLLLSIDPDIKVECFAGNILQGEVRDELANVDLILCCTDTNHSRTAVGELAYRYLIPTIDVGVAFEAEAGLVTGEIGRITFYSPGSPCAYCLGAVNSWKASVELMTEEEKALRKVQAADAVARGEAPNGYWEDVPELPTVGHFTTLAGSLIASYAIGWLTGKFIAPHRSIEFNILEPGFGYVGFDPPARGDCICQTLVGYADEGAFASVVSAPEHWPPVRKIGAAER
jgi:molybdopterin/thiamine biosynthesis adenylyltransferase